MKINNEQLMDIVDAVVNEVDAIIGIDSEPIKEVNYCGAEKSVKILLSKISKQVKNDGYGYIMYV